MKMTRSFAFAHSTTRVVFSFLCHGSYWVSAYAWTVKDTEQGPEGNSPYACMLSTSFLCRYARGFGLGRFVFYVFRCRSLVGALRGL